MYRNVAIAAAHTQRRTALAVKNPAIVLPPTHAATRMKYIVSTGYSSHCPPVSKHCWMNGSRFPASCSVLSSGTISE